MAREEHAPPLMLQYFCWSNRITKYLACGYMVADIGGEPDEEYTRALYVQMRKCEHWLMESPSIKSARIRVHGIRWTFEAVLKHAL